MPRSDDPTQVMSPGGHGGGELVAGRYRLDTHIGAGGSADVWRAYDVTKDRPVTLKLLRDRHDADARRRFIAEARRLETLDHATIVPVLGIHDATDATLITFEQVEGEPLDQVMRSRGPLPLREVARLVLDLAGGLEALHAHGFAHLDLKPANVLLAGDGRPRLLDFGSSGAIGHEPEVVLATPGFAAPEVARGQTASRAGDVYGLAALSRELLGERAARGAVGRVLARALDADPARRHQRARSFAVRFALAALLDGEVEAVRPKLEGIVRMARTARAELAALARDRDLSALRRPELSRALARLRADRVVAMVRARPDAFLRGAAVVLVVLALMVPQTRTDAQGGAAPTPEPNPTLTRATFDLPPFSAYAAAFESQAPYPAAAAGAMVEWTVALRNTGSAGWYRGIDGAQASLILADGTVVAVQSTPYVGPGQVGWFVARFRAPAEPGTHTVRFLPAINGRGPLPDLGLYAVVTVRAK